VFRIGGLVEDGSLQRGQGETITFRVTDTNATVPVAYTGVLPDLFGEGQGMVGTGSMQGGVFVATEILAKHDETYMPAEVVDALKAQGVYKDPASGGLNGS
jgi:cytochrome c-type biogenesis protein CcmE